MMYKATYLVQHNSCMCSLNILGNYVEWYWKTWVLYLLYGVGNTIITLLVALFEIIIAQSPDKMNRNFSCNGSSYISFNDAHGT